MKAFYRLFYYISILLTCALAGITLTGIFSGTTSPDDSQLIPFIGLGLPVLLSVNLIFAVYWIIRWRYWAFIPLIAILGNWNYLECIFQFPLFHSASEPKVQINAYTPRLLTVFTYNVNHFNNEQTGHSYKQIASQIRNLKVDIICFQEFGINNELTVDSLRTVFSEWPFYYVPSSPDGRHLLQLAVFSRYPIKEKCLITYPGSNNCSLWCDIEVSNRTIRLFNNHLQTTEVNRNKQKLEKEIQREVTQRTERAALTLIKGLYDNFRKRAIQANLINQLVSSSPHPTLVCGDFNSLPSSYIYCTIKGGKLLDGFQTCGHGYMYTFKYFKRLLRIDYILHSSEFKGIDYFSPNWKYSDHNPVIMRTKL